MARPKKTAPLEKYVRCIRKSRDWRQELAADDLWRRMIDLYRGKHYSKTANEDRMLVNLAFATKNVIAPSVAVNNPRFVVNARKPDGAATAIIAEQVLNYLWRTHKYQDEFRLAVDDFLIIGHGWLKVGYKATKPPQIKPLPDAVEGDDETVGVDDRDETVDGNVESEVKSFTDDDRPFVERISPFDIFVDPDARHPKEMNWIAQRVRRPVADVMVDERYERSVRIQAASLLTQQREDDGDRDIDGHPTSHDNTAYVDVWEYYDLRKNITCTFMANVTDGYLIEPRPIPYAFGHPFVMLRNYEIPDEFYPMGELESIEELQYELNETRTQMMNHRKKHQRKVLYDKEAFDNEGIAALRDDKDNVLVPVDTNSAQVDITKVVAPMPQVISPPEFYNQSDLISSDIDRVSGVSDYMRGATQNIRRTATEAAMIQDAQNSRAQDKLARIEQTLAQLGMRVVQLMQQFMVGEHVVRIVGMSAAPVWVQFDADYIKGEFDFEVEGGSTQPRNESFRRQSALQLVDAMAPFIGSGMVNPQAIIRHVLQFGFDVKDPDQFLGMPPQMGGMPPEQGAPPPPEMGGGMPPQGPPPEAAPGEDSPIPGIPAELVAQLVGSTGLSVE